MLKQLKIHRFFLIVMTLFFGFRVYYWLNTFEIPFSDMMDYVNIGKKVFADFAFDVDGFWQSYKPPTFPILIAVYFLFRRSMDVDYWGIFQITIHGFSLGLLYWGLRYQIKWRNYILFLIFCVAISSSSIFWSFKVATEYFAEIFIVLLIYCYLRLYNNTSTTWSTISGLVTMAAIFHRPQFLLVTLVPFVILLFNQHSVVFRIKKIGIFIISMGLLWLPWGLRSQSLYGKFLFISTQGPYSFLWEISAVQSIDGKGMVSLEELQKAATTNFSNDYDAMEYGNKHVKQWLLQNSKFYFFELLPRRLINSLTDNTEGLTKVDRISLYNNSMDKLVLRKHWWLIVLGCLGYIFGAYYDRKVLIVLFVPLLLWSMGLLFLGYPRILDPSIPYLVAGVYFFGQKLKNIAPHK